MHKRIRQCFALCMAGLLLSAASPGLPPNSRSAAYAQDQISIDDALKKSYVELFEYAEEPQYTAAEIDSVRDELKRAREMCVSRFKEKSKQYDKEIQRAQKQLKDRGARITESERHDLHCKIQNLRALQSQTEVLAKHAIPVAYENRKAKLDLIEQWPAQFREISKQLEEGTYRTRHWGDVDDIGFREIEKEQAKDIKTGQDAIREMKMSGLMPKELDTGAIVDYVNRVARRVSTHSDLKVPLTVTVLDSKEINAFALPGGFLFIERGLLEAVDDESELAGVIGHEMSHVIARHGHKLMMKATIANIFFQAAQVAAVLLTGGAAGIGTYYALQYGFYGLGLILDLNLLGVSREFELQADQLGIQYTWNSGYDPTGFIRFFDKMATTKGYVEGASWFYDHPPFYERMVEAEREITFLHKKKDLVVQTSEFNDMKKALVAVTAKAKEEEKTKPSLLAPETGCPAPATLEYEPGQPIETICAARSSKPTKQ
jgi:Zn-dependent protease with chaperone function